MRRGRPPLSGMGGRIPHDDGSLGRQEISEMIRQSIASVIPDIVRQTAEAIRKTSHDPILQSGRNNNFSSGGSGPSSGSAHEWLERFNKQKPLSFISAKEPVDAENWIRHIEKIFNALSCPDQFRVQLATYRFENDASSWWDACVQANPSVKDFSWEQFKEFFYGQHFSKADREAYIRDYATIHQRDDESVSDYLVRFLRTVRFAGSTAGTLEEQTNRFAWTLLGKYQDYIINLKFDNVTQVADAVKNLDRTRAARIAKQSDSKKKNSGMTRSATDNNDPQRRAA